MNFLMAKHHRLIALTTGVLLILHPSLASSDQAKQQQLPEEERITFVQAVRRIVGLSRRVAVGGSRSFGNSSICLITPALSERDGKLQARVAVPSPVIVTTEPLNELILLKEDGRVIYQKLASSTEAIGTPIPWPLTPLQGGERLTLKLRPQGASGADEVRIRLIVASADELKQNNAVLNRIKNLTKYGMLSRAIDGKVSTELLSQLIFTSSSSQQLSKDNHGLPARIKNACKNQQ